MSERKKPQSTIAITGYSGLLGNRVTQRISAMSGVHPIVLGRTVPLACMEHRYWDADCSLGDIVERLKGVDVLCHMAAYIPPNQSDPSEAQKCVAVNALATLTLARAAIDAGVQRIVFTSSANIITKSSGVNRETDQPIMQFKHAPYYLASKVLAESYLASLALHHDIEIQVLRLSSVYSPEGPSSILHQFAMNLKDNGHLTLTNGTLYGTDFVHAEDVVGLIVQSIRGASNGILNVGSGERTTLLKAAQVLADLLDKDESAIQNSDVSDPSDTLGFAALDITTARNVYNFNPRPIEHGLQEIVALAKDRRTLA